MKTFDDAAAARAAAVAAAAATPAPTAAPVSPPPAVQATGPAVPSSSSPRQGEVLGGVAVAPARLAVAPRADEPATLKLGDICGRLGITMTGAFVTDTLKVPAAKVDGRAQLYRESDFSRICVALQQHVERAHQAAREALAA